MKNIRLTLEYDGTRYQGWQHPGIKTPSDTISGRIKSTLCRMTGEKIELFCAARTEPGVHASCQTAGFLISSPLSPQEIGRMLNQYLPQDIAVLWAEEAPERFHASLNCLSQTYTYRVCTGTVPDVFRRKYMYHLPRPLDILAMQKAASSLLGTHDFRCFSSGKTKKRSEREIRRAEVISPGEGGTLHRSGSLLLPPPDAPADRGHSAGYRARPKKGRMYPRHFIRSGAGRSACPRAGTLPDRHPLCLSPYLPWPGTGCPPRHCIGRMACSACKTPCTQKTPGQVICSTHTLCTCQIIHARAP